MKRYIFLFLLANLVFSSSLYQKVVHHTDPDALCLDGSHPFLYVHEGGDKTKFIVYFLGGGLCEGTTQSAALQDCYKRSKTMFGTSTLWPPQIDGRQFGMMSTDPRESNFSTYTKFIIGYCDGAMHQGYRAAPISYKGANLYFRGAKITRSQFQYISNTYPSFKNAEQVIVSGTSAGGIATIQWSNYASTLVSNASNVISIIDSGVFLSFNTYKDDYPYLDTIGLNNYKLVNVDEKTPLKQCNLRYVGEEYKCMNINYAFTAMQTRALLIGSEYDEWVIKNGLKVGCLQPGKTEYTLSHCNDEEKAYIEKYRTQFKSFTSLFQQFSRNSLWTIGCSNHVYNLENKYYNAGTERVPMTTGLTIKDAVNAFALKGERVIAEETQPWPANNPCAY